MKVGASDRVLKKLHEKHEVGIEEIREYFLNRSGEFLEDIRVQHLTHQPTQWFIAETNFGRKLKIVFVEELAHGEIHIKTAYEPNHTEERIYEKFK